MSETLAPRREQAARSPAEVYDDQFVPALFRPWGPVLSTKPASARVSACSTWPVAPVH